MIHDRLIEIASTAPATSGLGMGDTFIPYADIVERVGRLAAGFAERGIGKGDVVALLVPNSPDIFAVAHALFAVGAIAMPLGLTATHSELVSSATKSGLAAVVAAPQWMKAASALIAEVAPPAQLFPTSELSGIERAPTRLPKLSGDTVAFYVFSSGSTGMPKVVPHTHSELLADGVRTSTAWSLTPDDIVIDILPPNFAMGFLMGAIDTLSGGASVLYWNDALPLALSRRKLLETLIAKRVTLIGAVPAMYEIIAGHSGAYDMSKLRLAFSGGAALKRPTFDAMRERFGITLRQAYGSSEAIFVAQNNSADPDADWMSVGPPVGDAEVRIAPFETELGPEVGELLVRSSSLMQGYLGDVAANAASFEDGWFKSGDLASLDAAGNITIRGRSKLLIEVSGYKIDPIEVEDSLVAHPAVNEAAVIGIADRGTGNRLRAYVVRDRDVSPDDLIRHVRSRLSAQKAPEEIEFVDALPKSPTGKLLRGRLG